MALCRELKHENVISLIETILEDKCIYMIFEYAEHDLLSIIHYHSHCELRMVPETTVRSLLWQLINGVYYLHENWVMHRDLKPANIMVTAEGKVKTGDLGLARLFKEPLLPLFNGDKLVVTIWYRAPELLLGARHYSPAIDMWAVGCIFAELLALRPIFKGEETKLDNKKNVPFQKNQLQKIVDVLGMPSVKNWSNISDYSEAQNLSLLKPQPAHLESWYKSVGASNPQGLKLLQSLLQYDPLKRLTAKDALSHPYFTDLPKISTNAFEGQSIEYPRRKVTSDIRDISHNGNNRRPADSNTTSKRRMPSSGPPEDQIKRVKGMA